jgi:hypothetical protein
LLAVVAGVMAIMVAAVAQVVIGHLLVHLVVVEARKRN